VSYQQFELGQLEDDAVEKTAGDSSKRSDSSERSYEEASLLESGPVEQARTDGRQHHVRMFAIPDSGERVSVRVAPKKSRSQDHSTE